MRDLNFLWRRHDDCRVTRYDFLNFVGIYWNLL